MKFCEYSPRSFVLACLLWDYCVFGDLVFIILDFGHLGILLFGHFGISISWHFICCILLYVLEFWDLGILGLVAFWFLVNM
jgi:hypothetical protein